MHLCADYSKKSKKPILASEMYSSVLKTLMHEYESSLKEKENRGILLEKDCAKFFAEMGEAKIAELQSAVKVNISEAQVIFSRSAIKRTKIYLTELLKAMGRKR